MCRRRRWRGLAGQELPWVVLRDTDSFFENNQQPASLPGATVDESRRRLHAGASRLIYPDLPEPLTSADLQRFFSPSHAEREWAPTIARSPTSQVVLLVQLKVFQAVGRFLSLRTIPRLIFEHVAHRLGVDGEIGFESSESTQHRLRKAILDRLGVTAWGTASRRLAHRTMITVAEARTDPAELINAAIDAW
jgi:hypothetical protein